ncbi:hypothetical protein AAFN88_14165 [Pelagibius sp. CAU 1746]|uniref:hypothetical protein n=1 Tax=Pelagibius sp. CAU 1746 TaxID=3140370 RepID=UPI00325BE9D0
MQFGLIPYRPGIGGYLAEFHPGPPEGCDWAEDSLYMDGDVFEALVLLIGAFSVKQRITVVQGDALGRLREDLQDAARQVSHADSPKAIWPYSGGYGYTQFNSVRDWPAERQAFTAMLRDLGAWVSDRIADGKPVTIRSV